MVKYLGSTKTLNKPLAYRAAFDVDNQVIYEAWAPTGTAESATSWQLCRNTWSGGNMTETKWPNGSGEFGFAWSLRGDYTYS